MKNLFFFLLLVCFCPQVFGQVAINNDGSLPDPSAMLDIKASNNNAKGFLLPRMSLFTRSAIVNPAAGLTIYQTTDNPGIYYFNGTNWLSISSEANTWRITGNTGLGLSTTFLGTLDDAPLRFRQNNLPGGLIKSSVAQTFFGANTAESPGGSYNSAFGTGALKNLLSASHNIAMGVGTLYNLDNENANIAIGDSAMFNYTNSISANADNVVMGYKTYYGPNAGIANTLIGSGIMQQATGNRLSNTALGASAMAIGTGGDYNVAIGNNAIRNNSGGNKNVAIGYDAANHNNNGSRNIAIGSMALFNQEGISQSIAIGDSALASYGTNLSSVTSNTAVGTESMALLSNGLGNTALGWRTLRTAASDSRYNVAIGADAMSMGQNNDYNVGIGYQTMKNANGANNVAIGGFALSASGGNDNTSLGYNSLSANAGSQNVAVGSKAGFSNISGINNTFLGYDADADVASLVNVVSIGYSSSVSTSNTFVLGNSSTTKWAFGLTTTPAGRALQVGSTSSNGNGAYLTSAGVWTNASDKNKKEDFSNIDGQYLLDKIAQLDITRWRYKGTREYHIGPMAQDFYALFRTGEDDKAISTIDPSGIALAAIKELIKQNEALKKEIEALKAKVGQ